MVLLTMAIVWIIPKWQLAGKKGKLELDKYLNLENEYRKTIAQTVGGLYVLGGFVFTWLQLLATQDSIVLSQERLITDRYSKAIDQLGGTSTQTRLGGIYSLGSIAKTSPDYVSMVDNVLASYIRQNFQEDSALKEELQTSINILTRKQYQTVQRNNAGVGINLSKVKLHGFDFNKSLLQKVNLNEADLNRSLFIEANLSGVEANAATFVRANLSGAFIEDGQFFGADFTQASLNGASLKNSNLKMAKFKEADLSNANLSGCDMTGVDMERAKLYGANLQQTKGLTKELLKSCLINKETKLPDL